MHHLYLSYQPSSEALSQERAVLEAWCGDREVLEYRILEERLTNGRISERMIRKMLDSVEAGDVVVACSLTRLGRGINMLLGVVTHILGKGASFYLIDEDRMYAPGQGSAELVAHLEFAAQIVSQIKTERGNEALLPDHQKGIWHGRPVGSKKAAQKNVLYGKEETVLRMKAEGQSAEKIAAAIGVSRGTVYNFLKASQR